MATATEICNLALLRIGHKRPIASLDEASTEARLCKVAYPRALQLVLATAPWSFAQKRATLALLADTTRTNWAYVYALPADFVAVQGLTVVGVADPDAEQMHPYSLEADAAGQTVLATDLDDAELVYTSKVTSNIPPLAENAIAWALASDLVLGITNKLSQSDWAYRRFLQALSAAMASDLNQTRAAPWVSAFERARS